MTDMEPLFNTNISGLKDVSAAEFITCFSQHLKRQGKIEIPKWVDYVKTGYFKELAPTDPDWLYVRAAAIIRKLYIRPAAGVGDLRRSFGGVDRRGTCPNRYTKASGKVIRYLLQQLEEMGLIEQHAKGGRIITSEGRRECDLVSHKAAELRPEQPDEE